MYCVFVFKYMSIAPFLFLMCSAYRTIAFGDIFTNTSISIFNCSEHNENMLRFELSNFIPAIGKSIEVLSDKVSSEFDEKYLEIVDILQPKDVISTECREYFWKFKYLQRNSSLEDSDLDNSGLNNSVIYNFDLNNSSVKNSGVNSLGINDFILNNSGEKFSVEGNSDEKFSVENKSRLSNSNVYNSSLDKKCQHYFSPFVNNTFVLLKAAENQVKDLLEFFSENTYVMIDTMVHDLNRSLDRGFESASEKNDHLAKRFDRLKSLISCHRKKIKDAKINETEIEETEIKETEIKETEIKETEIKETEIKVTEINQTLEQILPSQTVNQTYSGPARQCSEIPLDQTISNGPLSITYHPEMKPKTVWCDGKWDGGGWTQILHRSPQRNQLDFRRSFSEYENGFGSAGIEYWIGLKALHHLTKATPQELVVLIGRSKEKAYARYSTIKVSGAEDGYRLNLRGFFKESTAGDSLQYHHGMKFSTYDRDHDNDPVRSCSIQSGGGGFWYNFCFYANPTGIYPPAGLPEGAAMNTMLEWRRWKGYYTFLTHLTMMIRPIDY